MNVFDRLFGRRSHVEGAINGIQGGGRGGDIVMKATAIFVHGDDTGSLV